MTDHPVELEHEAPSERLGILAPVITLLVLLTLVIGGAAVISDDGGPDPLELLSAAPDAVREAGTARIVMSATIDAAGMDVTMDGEGAIDFVTGAQILEMSILGFSFEMRIVDQVMYVRIPEMALPAGSRSWIGVPLEYAEGAANPMTQTQSPTAMIDALRATGADIEELGPDEIDGTPVTGYRVVIDMEDAIDQAPPDERDAMRAQVENMRSMGLDEWPMDVWLNDDGLPVRMTMEIETKGDIGVPAVSMQMQMDYVDFGADVVIEAPPADDTTLVDGLTEMTELLGGVEPIGEPAA